MPRHDSKTQVVSLRLSRRERAAIQRRAKRNDRGFGEELRELLADAIDQEPEEEEGEFDTTTADEAVAAIQAVLSDGNVELDMHVESFLLSAELALQEYIAGRELAEEDED